MRNRKFEGKNPFLSVGPFVAIALILYMSITVDRSGMSTIDFIYTVGLWLSIPILTLFGRVYVAKNSTVYHSKRGCAGATKKKNRLIAKIQGLQPCAKCHKIKGMGR